jgi:hypothetical protein
LSHGPSGEAWRAAGVVGSMSHCVVGYLSNGKSHRKAASVQQHNSYCVYRSPLRACVFSCVLDKGSLPVGVVSPVNSDMAMEESSVS